MTADGPASGNPGADPVTPEPAAGAESGRSAAVSRSAVAMARAARFAEDRVMPALVNVPLLLARAMHSIPLLHLVTYVLSVVERVALPMFLMVLMFRDSSPGSMLALTLGSQCSILLRSVAWTVVSLRNTKAAARRLTDPGFRISEVDDFPRHVSREALSELHRYRDQPPMVRVFVTLARDGVQIDDRTFTSYRGTSYVCMARDPRQARRAGVKFRLLHELGHASGAAMGNVEYEIVPVMQIAGLGVVLYAFAPATPVSIAVTGLLIAFIHTIVKPFGPNREGLERECAADEFAIRHLETHEVREGLDDALINPYRYQLRRLARARNGLDRTYLDKISLEFPDRSRIDTLDRLRPSFHTSRSPNWLRGHELQRVAVRAAFAQLALIKRLTRPRGAQLDTGSPYTQIPGWWQVRPLFTVPLVFLAAFQVDLPRLAWIWFLAAAVVLFFAHAFMSVRAGQWEMHIDGIVARRTAGEESEEDYRREAEAAIAAAVAARPQPPVEQDPPSWPAACRRALVTVLPCSLSATLLVASSPSGVFHTLSAWLAMTFLSIVPATYAYQRTQSLRIATAARRLAHLPATTLLVLVLLHLL